MAQRIKVFAAKLADLSPVLCGRRRDLTPASSSDFHALTSKGV